MWRPNKVLVPTLPALRNFNIIARHKGLGGGFGFVLPVRALAGRTTQALAGWKAGVINHDMERTRNATYCSNHQKIWDK